MASHVDPDQMPQYATSDLGIHWQSQYLGILWLSITATFIWILPSFHLVCDELTVPVRWWYLLSVLPPYGGCHTVIIRIHECRSLDNFVNSSLWQILTNGKPVAQRHIVGSIAWSPHGHCTEVAHWSFRQRTILNDHYRPEKNCIMILGSWDNYGPQAAIARFPHGARALPIKSHGYKAVIFWQSCSNRTMTVLPPCDGSTFSRCVYIGQFFLFQQLSSDKWKTKLVLIQSLRVAHLRLQLRQNRREPWASKTTWLSHSHLTISALPLYGSRTGSVWFPCGDWGDCTMTTISVQSARLHMALPWSVAESPYKKFHIVHILCMYATCDAQKIVRKIEDKWIVHRPGQM